MNSLEIIDYRHKIISGYLYGKTMDVGFADYPNPYLSDAVGIDVKRAPKPKNYSQVLVADADKPLPFKNEAFNNVIASQIIAHLKCSFNLFKEVNRILKPHGRFVIGTINPTTPFLVIKNELFNQYNKGEHINELPPHIIEIQLERNGFKIIDKRGISLTIPVLAKWFSYFKRLKCKSLFLSDRILYVAEKK